MATFTAITESGRQFNLNIEIQSVTSNCGACLLYGVGLRVFDLPKSNLEKSPWSLDKSPTQKHLIFPSNRLSLKEISDGLLDVWNKSGFRGWIEDHCKGFAIFTDNINFYLNQNNEYANFLVEDALLETTKASSLSTSGFVTWLIKNKIGAVGRGITTVNKRHSGSSVLTSWTWAPGNDMILSMEQPHYPNGEMPEPKNSWTALKELAKDHNEREMRFGLTKTKVLNVKRATVRIPKRKGINTPRRIRKLP